MTDGFTIDCPTCGELADLSLGLTPNEYGQLICAGCGGEIPIPVAAPAESVGDATTTAAGGGLPTVVDAQHVVHAAEGGSVESMLGDCGSGRYSEQGTIGKGGMGEIVLCVEYNTRREVAMKRLLPTAAGHAKQRARFVEEAQVTAQLEHPNIVPVHELGRDARGAIYFTMKFVKGRSLAEILTASRDGEEYHSLGELLGMFLKVCDGVAFAHSRGVVHRDLKPANIMVGDFGEVLVMDWGIARILGRDEIAGEDDKNNVQSSRQDTSQAGLHTVAGAAMGSPSYMPPEQALGQHDKIDHRSDIYSLGAILYNILTLKLPVEGQTARVIMDKVIAGDIHPPERRASDRDIPRELSAVAMKCLAKHRRGRYASVPDLQRDISLYLEGRSVSAAPDTFAQALVKLVKRNKPVSLAVGATAVILIAVVSVAFVRVTGAMQRAITGERQAVTERQAAQKARDKQRATAIAASRELSERAVRAADEGRWVEADISVAAARKILPDGPWGHYAAGTIAWKRKDIRAARMELTRALVCDPGHAESRIALDRIVAPEGTTTGWHAFSADGDRLVSQRRYRDAESTYARALDMFARAQYLDADQKDWRKLIVLGDTFVAQEFYPDAVAAYERAIEQMSKAQAVPPKIPNQVAEKLKSLQKASEATRMNLEHKKSNAIAGVKCEGFYESIKDLDAKEQAQRIAAKLKDIHGRGIGFKYDIEDKVLVAVHLDGRSSREAMYLQPLAYFPLMRLSLNNADVRDLGPLKGMPLKSLSITGCPVLTDLSPLKGMPLTMLDLANCESLTDLAPLKGMALTKLKMDNCKLLKDLSPLKGMRLTELISRRLVLRGDLSALEGMKLTSLIVDGCESLTSLRGIEGMPLTYLNIKHTRLSDLTPLEGMGLTGLSMEGCSSLTSLKGIEGMGLTGLGLKDCRALQGDLSALKGMKLTRLDLHGCSSLTSLKGIEGMGLTRLDLHGCSSLTSLKGIEDIPLTDLNLDKCHSLSSLKGIEGAPLASLNLRGCRALQGDLSALKGMKLTSLNLEGCSSLTSLKGIEGMPLTALDARCRALRGDLSALKGMKLTQLNLEGCSSLTSLKGIEGMPLTYLNIKHTRLSDLTPLKGMGLTGLGLKDCRALQGDLSALKGMKLTRLDLHGCSSLTSLKGIEGMKLTSLNLNVCSLLTSLKGIEGMGLTELGIVDAGVSDLSGLRGMMLERFYFTPKKITKGIEIIRGMKSIKQIGVRSEWKYWMTPEEFWKRYDAGEFK